MLAAALGWPWGLIVASATAVATGLALRATARAVTRETRETARSLPVVPSRGAPGRREPSPTLAESPLVARLGVDAEGHVVWASALAGQLLGVAVDQLRGAATDAFLPKLIEVARDAGAAGGRRRWTLRTAAGAKAVEVAILQDGPAGWVIELVDVTADARALSEARAAQREATASRADRERLLQTYGVAVRARAGEMTEILTLLEGEPLSAELTGPLRHARTTSAALLEVTGDILALARSEGEPVESAFSPLGLVEETLRRRAEDEPTKASWISAVAPGVEPLVIGDRTRLRRVLDNLVTHATTVARSGVVEVRVATPDDPETGRARLAITLRDVGPARRFGDGSWTGPAGDAHAAGAGLELYVARSLAAPLGGEIAVEEDGGRGPKIVLRCPVVRPALATPGAPQRLDGLRVTLELSRAEEVAAITEYLEALGAKVRRAPTVGPVGAADVVVTEASYGRDVDRARGGAGPPRIVLGGQGFGEEVRAHVRRPVAPSELIAAVAELGHEAREGAVAVAPVRAPAAERRGRALLVDDDGVNQLVAARMLEELGFGVTVASDGVRALAAARAGGFDVILMDWHLPGLDGLEVTRRLRAEGGRAAGIPIIALTGRVMPEDIASCRAAGMDAHLAKPLTRARLAETLARCLPGSGGSRVTPRPSVGP